MRLLAILGVCLLAGCGTFTTMEELEQQAMLTGDWSAVEQRERILAKREMRFGHQCPTGHVKLCESGFGRIECECVANGSVGAVLAVY